MTWLGWQNRSRWLESIAHVCPHCQIMRSMSARQRQRAFVFFGLRLSRWSDLEDGAFVECESCGAEIPGSHVLHESTRIAKLEAVNRKDEEDLDEAALSATRQCPHCGRELGLTSKICPRCENRIPQ